MQELKVLNIAQPNAHFVIFNGKNVENRTKPANFRGTIAIYSSKTFNKERFDHQELVKKEECAFGCIIGLVELVDSIDETEVTKATEEWFTGPYGYVFKNIFAFKDPIPVTPPKGAIIWWPLKGAMLEEVIKQAGDYPIKPLVPVPKDELKEREAARLRARLTPTAELCDIIGDYPVTINEALNSLIDYIEEHELFESKDDGNDLVFADSKLKKIFGKDEVFASEVKDLTSVHLKKSS